MMGYTSFLTVIILFLSGLCSILRHQKSGAFLMVRSGMTVAPRNKTLTSASAAIGLDGVFLRRRMGLGGVVFT